MKVKDVMTMDPCCCERAATAHKAANLMLEMDVGIVPVVDNESDKRLVGVVTDRDLCISVIAGGKDPTSTRLEECMSAEIVSCSPEDDVRKVFDLMNQRQVRRIPVIDADNHVAGIVSTKDIALNTESLAKVGDTLKHISES